MNSSIFLLKKLLYLILVIFLFGSCAKKTDYIYFQQLINDSTKLIVQKPFVPVLKPDDVISITITSVDPDVVKPFNNGGVSAVDKNSLIQQAPTYLINEQGEIDFPVLGLVKIVGLTRAEVTALIKERVKSYVNNPIVNVKIMNHKVTILGDVKSPGVFLMPNEQLTLPEALAMAGDLQITAVRKNVLVIRDDKGKKSEIRVDLTNRSFFNSSVYYLQNNDLIYVEPNNAKIVSSKQTLQYTSLAVGSLGLILNILNLLIK
jgi:polysaccharide export outer membrane protein